MDIENHNLATQEAQWTHREALNWAVDRFYSIGWPRRRFRVESGTGGNSRLTTKTAAQRLQARVGGSVVEVIPPSTQGAKIANNFYRNKWRNIWHDVAMRLYVRLLREREKSFILFDTLNEFMEKDEIDKVVKLNMKT